MMLTALEKAKAGAERGWRSPWNRRISLMSLIFIDFDVCR
jgi:hypothetical protein